MIRPVRIPLLILALAAALLSAHADDPAPAPLKGDGKADDTAALQAALDRLSVGWGSALMLPSGTYRVTAPLVLRGTLNSGAAIRGEVCSPGGGGTTILFDGKSGAPCVLELAGGFGVSVESLRIDCNRKAQFGVYLHDDLPRAGMSDVTLRDVAVGSPLPGDSPVLAKGARSAAISIGLKPDGSPHTGQCDAIKLVGITLASTGDKGASHYGIATGTANVKNFFIEHPWICGFRVGLSIPNGTGTCTVTGGAGLSNTTADFLLGSGVLAVTGWESEGSARLLTTPGWHSAYASASFDRCAWYGAPADDIAVFFGGCLSLRGCDLRNNRTPTSVPKIAMIEPQNGSATSLVSEQNFYQNARDSPPAVFVNWNATASLMKSGAYPPWIRSFGDLGGQGGKLTPLAVSTATVVPAVSETLRAKDLVLSGSIDFGDGRKWTPQGLFMSKDRYWTADGLYPDMIKIKDVGTIRGDPRGGLEFVDWEEKPPGSGNRRHAWIVPPLRTK